MLSQHFPVFWEFFLQMLKMTNYSLKLYMKHHKYNLHTKLAKLYSFSTQIKDLLQRNFPVCPKRFTKYFLELSPISPYNRDSKVFQKVFRAIIKQHENNFPAIIHLLKVYNKNARIKCEICSKLTIQTPEQCKWCHSDVFIVNFEHISHLTLVFFC